VWEEAAGGAAKAYHSINGQVVAVRDRSANAITYLHGDHLGSVSVATTSGGALASQQEYTPYGSHRGTGDITQTTLDYTGQRLDATGLLYYHARYYDPNLGRFISPDSIVPQPSDPQSLNRYTYANNNPLRYSDPSGHCPICIGAVVGALADYAYQVYNNLEGGMGWGDALTSVDAGEIAEGALVGAAVVAAAPLVLAAGTAIAGAVAGGGTAAAVAETAATVTGAACADGDCGNELSAVSSLATQGAETLAPTFEAAEGELAGLATRGPGLSASSGSLFRAVENEAGGQVWVSNNLIYQSDFEDIVDNASGPVNILTGTHGDPEGSLIPERFFYQQDLQRWSSAPNVSITDITRAPGNLVGSILNGPGTIVCAWCFSESSTIVWDLLK
jgi:RHS repeat-associated protein